MDFGATILIVLLAFGTAFLGLISMADARQDLKRGVQKKLHFTKSEREEYKQAA